MTIETERLLLRPFQNGDEEDVFEYLNEPAVNCFVDMKLHSIEEARKEILKRSSETEYYFAIVLKETGRSAEATNQEQVTKADSQESGGKGYARPLLNAMLDKCRELQFKEVRFTTKPGVMSIGYALYQRMGFEELENDGETVLMSMMLDYYGD